MMIITEKTIFYLFFSRSVINVWNLHFWIKEHNIKPGHTLEHSGGIWARAVYLVLVPPLDLQQIAAPIYHASR